MQETTVAAVLASMWRRCDTKKVVEVILECQVQSETLMQLVREAVENSYLRQDKWKEIAELMIQCRADPRRGYFFMSTDIGIVADQLSDIGALPLLKRMDATFQAAPILTVERLERVLAVHEKIYTDRCATGERWVPLFGPAAAAFSEELEGLLCERGASKDLVKRAQQLTANVRARSLGPDESWDDYK